MAMTLKQAAGSLAADIRSGAVHLGKGQYLHDDGSPCCAYGHLAHRMGISAELAGPMAKLTVDVGMRTSGSVLAANDHGHFDVVADLLDEVANG